MPSNYTMMYDVHTREKQTVILQEAENEIDKIAKLLEAGEKCNFAFNGYLFLLAPIIYPIYGIYRKTRKFYATEDCKSCGSCEKTCNK